MFFLDRERAALLLGTCFRSQIAVLGAIRLTTESCGAHAPRMGPKIGTSGSPAALPGALGRSLQRRAYSGASQMRACDAVSRPSNACVRCADECNLSRSTQADRRPTSPSPCALIVAARFQTNSKSGARRGSRVSEICRSSSRTSFRRTLWRRDAGLQKQIVGVHTTHIKRNFFVCEDQLPKVH